MEEQTSGGGWGVKIAVVCAVLIVIALISVPVTANLATVQTERTAQTQATENGKSERAADEQKTLRTNADLRAESDARLQNIFGVLVLLVVGVFLLSWSDGKQTQRTLLILEAQRQPYAQIERPLRSVNRLAREAQTVEADT